MRAQPFDPLAVGEHNTRATVEHAVLEFGPEAPRIERRDHRPDRLRSPESEGPFREIAHGDGYTVALCHAVSIGQDPAERTGGPEVLAVGLALALVDDELAVAPSKADVEQLPQRAHGLLVDTRRYAPNQLLLGLEQHAWAGEYPVGLLHRD